MVIEWWEELEPLYVEDDIDVLLDPDEEFLGGGQNTWSD
jgi:hypothetical protein